MSEKKGLNFGLIGAAGYIAPRHIKAIADTGNNLMVAYDKFDSVGRLDSSFPECSFFTENEQFDRFCSKQMRTAEPLHWMSICTPNYTHDAFIRYGLRLGCDVICEKPLVLNPYNIDNLVELEKETGHRAYTILQLRLHEKIRELKAKIDAEDWGGTKTQINPACAAINTDKQINENYKENTEESSATDGASTMLTPQSTHKQASGLLDDSSCLTNTNAQCLSDDSSAKIQKIISPQAPTSKWNGHKHEVDLTYITSRGKWYYSSWKGNIHKSGGIATNIGVHLYDMLQWVFGPVQQNIVHVMSFDRVAGYLELEKARVRYFLSINADCLPENAVQGEKRTYRTLSIDGEEFEFSAGFTELHTESYKKILAGEGFRISEARPCIETVSQIRNCEPIGLVGDYHPLAKLPLAKHPFGWDERR